MSKRESVRRSIASLGKGVFLIWTMALFHKATSVLTSDPSMQWRCVTAFVLRCLDAEIVALLRDIP